MRVFWELSKLSFQRQLTYRAATIAGIATNLFFGLLRAAVLLALYGEQRVVANLSAQGAVTFAGISQAVIGYLSIFSWYHVMNSVYSGDIATDLLKPIEYFRYWMAQDLGRAVASLLTRSLPIIALYALIFDLTVPNRIQQWGFLSIAMVLSWLISFSFRFLINLTAFWSPFALGIGRFGFLLIWFLSGFLMPLRFFPDWFITFCYSTPFPYMINSVIEVYLGLITGTTLLTLLMKQLLWAATLILACHVVFRAGVRRLVILGG